jgi:hypothetical protein
MASDAWRPLVPRFPEPRPGWKPNRSRLHTCTAKKKPKNHRIALVTCIVGSTMCFAADAGIARNSIIAPLGEDLADLG